VKHSERIKTSSHHKEDSLSLADRFWHSSTSSPAQLHQYKAFARTVSTYPRVSRG